MDDYLNQSKRSSFSFNDITQFLILLLVAKCFKSFGIYIGYDLLKHLHVVQLLFYTSLIASIFFIILQKPFNISNSSKRLNKFQYYRIFKYSFVLTIIKILYFFGLSQCGPLRTTLLFEQSEFVIICALKALFLSQTNPSRTRGVCLLIIATIILLAFDSDSLNTNLNADENSHPEGNHHGILSHLFYFIISKFGVSDHKAGVVLLVFTLLLHIGFNQTSLSKVLVSDIGGVKRLKALSTCMSTLLLSPWAIYNLFSKIFDSDSNPTFTTLDINTGLVKNTLDASHSWIYYLIPLVFMTLFLFVIDFYIETYISQKTDPIYTAKLGSVFVFTSSVALSFVWNHPHLVKVVVMDKIKTIIEQEHSLSWGVIISFILYILATDMISRPLAKEQKGSFIGYSSVGNPLYSLTGETLKRTSMSMITIIKNIIREILSHQDSRRIFYFLCLNLIFCFVELGYGVFSNSLSLISDGVHMLFDCSALVLGLVAAVVSQWKPTRIFSYGFGRLELLSGFINGLFLIVISLFVFIEAINRVFEPPEIKSSKLIYVSFIGLCVNLFGIFAFSHAHSHGGVVHDSPSHNHSHGSGSTHSHSHSSCQSNSSLTSDNDNMRGVYLHVLADTLGSVGVIISSFLMQQFGLYIADPICSICIASMIFISVIPLLKHSSSLLILRTPFSKEIQFENLLKRILNIEGVISYRDDHLWQLSSGSSYIATIHVQITSNSYEQLISAQINGLLKELKLTNLTVQLEKEVFFQHLIGLGANMGQMSDSNRVYKDRSIDSNTLINVEKYV